jgi:hypothetical protein
MKPLVSLILLSAAALHAQNNQPRDSWMMKNYHFAGAPAPTVPPDQVLAELRQIQDTLLSIMRKADFARDYEAALAAAAQATETAQLIGSIQQQMEAAAAAMRTIAQEAKSRPAAPIYFIAFKDQTVETATRIWADRLMIHYMTPEGAHVQVSREVVDRGLSERLNRDRVPDFSLPE